ncbi:tetratricopeptide repeat protein [Pelagicoccus mobilis]|uniref:Tetratricopeptide repeat protein n=1 Tax=Pelagicoccus mobilis TaxID=415221 RepID=A0A934RWL4_9BACT|nr:hypothetical protein [Pelagicoccus mobilis]MBK1877678.1 hypothetical protein [Pelagicoccus mobilis]
MQVFTTQAQNGPSLWAGVDAMRSLEAKGRSEQAKQLAVKVQEVANAQLDESGDSEEVHVALGVAAQVLHRDYLAIHHLKKALEFGPDNLDTRISLASVLSGKGKHGEACDLLLEKREMFEGDPRFDYALARSWINSGESEKGVSSLEAQLKRDPSNRRVFDDLLDLYLRGGALEQASVLLDQLVLSGEISEAEKLIHLIDSSLEAGELQKARGYIRNARKQKFEQAPIDQREVRVYDALAKEAWAQEQQSRALLYWKRALAIDPKSHYLQRRVGSAHVAKGEYEEGLKHLKGLLETKPADPEYYIDLAYSFHATGERELAYKILLETQNVTEKSGNMAASQRIREVLAKLYEKDKREEVASE